MAESESFRKREIYKNKVKEDKLTEKSQRGSYYILKNLLKNKKNIPDFFKETPIQVNLITDLQSISNTARESKILEFTENKISSNKKITKFHSKEKLNKIFLNLQVKKSKKISIESQDKLKLIDLYRNGTRSKTFNEINQKILGNKINSFSNNENGKNKNRYSYLIQMKTINFTDEIAENDSHYYNNLQKNKIIKNGEKTHSEFKNPEQIYSMNMSKEKICSKKYKLTTKETKPYSPSNFRLVSPHNFSLEFQNDLKFNAFETDIKEEYNMTIQTISKQKTSQKNSLRIDLIREIESIEKEKNEGILSL